MERPVLSEDPLLVPDSLRHLCEECWAADKSARPTFVEVCISSCLFLFEGVVSMFFGKVVGEVSERVGGLFHLR